MITFINKGKSANFGTVFYVMRNDEKVGVAYRAESGKRRGIYSFGNFTGSRARLAAHVETLA